MAAIGRGGVAGICLLVTAIAWGQTENRLGPTVKVVGLFNQATTRHEHHGECGVQLLEAGASDSRTFFFENATKFGTRPLQVLSYVADSDRPTLYVPRQEFTLYGERTAESPHVTQHETSIFHGRFVLFYRDPRWPAPVHDFFGTMFPVVRTDLERTAFLVPLDQRRHTEDILAGTVEPPEIPSAQTYTGYVPPVSVQPGLARTGRGTYYQFSPDAVTVYSRNGAVKEISLRKENENGYAAHVEILRRMGIVRPEDMTVGQQIAAAIARNAEATAGVPPAIRGVMNFRLRELRARYNSFNDAAVLTHYWGGSAPREKRNTLLWTLLQQGDVLPPFLPSRLQMYDSTSPVLHTAPVDGEGISYRRVQRPFLVFAEDLRGEAEPVAIRIGLERSSLHLQIAHAYFGDWTYELDASGAIGGGVLEYVFSDANPPELQSIELTDDGYISHATGKRRTLSPAAVEWVLRRLQHSLPFKFGREFRVERRPPSR